jgi:hypothetical protein
MSLLGLQRYAFGPVTPFASTGLCAGRPWHVSGQHTRSAGVPRRYGTHDVDDDASTAR